MWTVSIGYRQLIRLRTRCLSKLKWMNSQCIHVVAVLMTSNTVMKLTVTAMLWDMPGPTWYIVACFDC